MPRWGVTAACGVLAVLAGACSSSDGAAPPTTAARATSTTVPVRPTSTTTTIYDPATVEGQVEAAYLRSWDVYAEAVYHLELDEQAFAEVYAERSLETRTEELRNRIIDRRAALVRIEHNYEVAVVDAETAAVVDRFINHQVLIDPESKEPTESDPNEAILVNFKMRLLDERWKVVLIQKVQT